MFVVVALLITGFAVLIKGADFMVAGSASLAKNHGISNLAIGLTVVAFGTSMPELVVSLISALSGRTDAAFGNVIGSNNFNLFFILGLSGAITPLVVQRNTVRYEVPLSLAIVGVLYLMVNGQTLGIEENHMLSRADSIILLVIFGLFLIYIYRTMHDGADLEETGSFKQFSTLRSVGLVILGTGMLVGGGKLVVDNAITIAVGLGMTEKLIGLTILATGTSLPELATSLVAAYRKQADIAIGNVVGSNIFNILLILGVTGTIAPVPFNSQLNFDLKVLMGGTVLLILFMFTHNARKLDRWEAVILTLSYVTYVIYLILHDHN